MQIPATWHLRVTPGRTFKARFRAPFDLTGYSLYASCCNPQTKVKLFDFTIEMVDVQGGWFDLILDKETTSLLTENAVWDLLVVQPNDESFDMLEGNVYFDPACTQEPSAP